MSDHWLDIHGETIDAAEIMRRIEQRRSSGRGAAPAVPQPAEDPLDVARALRDQMLGSDTVPRSLLDRIQALGRASDIVPRNYTIGWRYPLLGWVHAWVRKLIHAELRRYLLPGLEKQAYLNRHMTALLAELAQENARLRRQLDELRD